MSPSARWLISHGLGSPWYWIVLVCVSVPCLYVNYLLCDLVCIPCYDSIFLLFLVLFLQLSPALPPSHPSLIQSCWFWLLDLSLISLPCCCWHGLSSGAHHFSSRLSFLDSFIGVYSHTTQFTQFRCTFHGSYLDLYSRSSLAFQSSSSLLCPHTLCGWRRHSKTKSWSCFSTATGLTGIPMT